jgi:hypothetical protein
MLFYFDTSAFNSKWATTIIQEFTVKGFTMGDERLKNDGSVLGKQYFEEQLQRIREIPRLPDPQITINMI